MKKLMMAFAASLCVCASAWGMEDSYANRAAQADRYLVAMPVSEMMSDIAEFVGKNLPAEKRPEFKELLTKHVDMLAIEKAMKQSLVERFTADELEALANLYGNAAGKSAIKKYNGYMAGIMPVIQTEVKKAKEAQEAKAKAASQPKDETKGETKDKPKSEAKPAK